MKKKKLNRIEDGYLNASTERERERESEHRNCVFVEAEKKIPFRDFEFKTLF